MLHYHFKGDYWDFPRGKIENGESEEEAAKREIEEETGLINIKLVEGFRETTHWFYRWQGRNVYKEAVYFLAEAGTIEIKISGEHLEFLWADFEKALQTLTYNNTKKILQAAHEFLQKWEGKQDKSGIEKFLKDK